PRVSGRRGWPAGADLERERELHRLRRELRKADEKVNWFRNQVIALQQQVSSMGTPVMGASTAAAMPEELERLRAEVARHRTELADERAEKESLRSQLREAQDRAGASERELAGVRRELASARSWEQEGRMADLDRELAAVRAELAAARWARRPCPRRCIRSGPPGTPAAPCGRGATARPSPAAGSPRRCPARLGRGGLGTRWTRARAPGARGERWWSAATTRARWARCGRALRTPSSGPASSASAVGSPSTASGCCPTTPRSRRSSPAQTASCLRMTTCCGGSTGSPPRAPPATSCSSSSAGTGRSFCPPMSAAPLPRLGRTRGGPASARCCPPTRWTAASDLAWWPTRTCIGRFWRCLTVCTPRSCTTAVTLGGRLTGLAGTSSRTT
ncbi:unnamed protein product, partial [Prorocentrum cordatum]